MEATMLALLGILHTGKTASLTHFVSWSPAFPPHCTPVYIMVELVNSQFTSKQH